MAKDAQTILYVEDEENDVVLVRFAFKRAGIAQPVAVVENGKEALDYLCGSGVYSDRVQYPFPCLVLLDLNIPQLNGLEVLQRLRGDTRFKLLPVIVFTSSEQPSDKSLAYQLGATEYMVKPSRADRLALFAQDLKTRWLND